MRKHNFVNNEYFHIYNRGVDKRNIFLDYNDYKRFLKSLQFFNSMGSTWLSFIGDTPQQLREEDKLVDILCYCLMPNHYHILLKQKNNNGITMFMRKLNTGYTMYFNTKYERTGRLFENKFKAVHVENDDYFKHLSRYIHLNPLDLKNPNWREGKITQIKTSLRYLENYPWSSFSSYVSSNSHHDQIIAKNLLTEIFDRESYKDFVTSWMNRGFDRLMGLTFE